MGCMRANARWRRCVALSSFLLEMTLLCTVALLPFAGSKIHIEVIFPPFSAEDDKEAV